MLRIYYNIFICWEFKWLRQIIYNMKIWAKIVLNSIANEPWSEWIKRKFFLVWSQGQSCCYDRNQKFQMFSKFRIDWFCWRKNTHIYNECAYTDGKIQEKSIWRRNYPWESAICESCFRFFDSDVAIHYKFNWTTKIASNVCWFIQ